MRRLIAVILILLMTAAMLMLTGCEQAAVKVESTLNMNENFSGSRTVKVLFPLSAHIDSVKDTIVESFPAAGAQGLSFDYTGVEEDGYAFLLKIDFSDRNDYTKKISAVLGRGAEVYLSFLNTPLTKGTRMKEDFDTADLISFVRRAAASDANTAPLGFDCSLNTVTIGSQTYHTDSTVDISEREGSAVTSLTIDTVNTKNVSFDRTITFSLPKSTYESSKTAIEKYFDENVNDDAMYKGWSEKGENVEFSVIYQGLGIEMLKEYTAKLLSSENESVFYGDKDNSSTPLSEGLAFEERFDTFAFMGEEGAVPVHYTYSLPTETTHGDGTLKTNGVYKTSGEWVSGVYSVDCDTDTVSLRIPDGIEYFINGINFRLVSVGKDTFKRTTDFLYSKSDGYDGMAYAQNFFSEKGASTEVSEDDDNLILSVICEGSAKEITAQLVSCFGSGNFLSYEHQKSTFSLSDKTTLTDYVNLGYMLNSKNANRPMSYSVSSVGEENIVSLSSDTADTVYRTSDSKNLSLPVTAGNATVSYKGNIPIISRLIVFILVSIVLLILTVGSIILLIKAGKRRELRELGITPPLGSKKKKKKKTEIKEYPDEFSTPLMQTTTFSITELSILSKNKKYLDEINKDVEARIEKDRLTQKKKEIREKELSDLEEKVYGKSEEDEIIEKLSPKEEPKHNEPSDPVEPAEEPSEPKRPAEEEDADV